MKLGTAGWVLAAIVLLILALDLFANKGDDEKIRDLEKENADLVESDSISGVQIDFYRRAVEEADSAAKKDSIAAQARVDAAHRATGRAEDRLREALGGQPEIVAMLDSLVEAHRKELDAERSRAARQDLLRLAQIAARDSLIVSQDSTLTIRLGRIDNLTEQVAYWKREARPPFALRIWRGLKETVAVSACAGAGALVSTDSPEYGAAIGAGICSMAF